MTDRNDGFEGLANEAFSDMEKAMGTVMYHAQAKMHEVNAEHLKAHAEVLSSKTYLNDSRAKKIEQQTNVMGAVGLIMLSVALPVTVRLWRWALR